MSQSNGISIREITPNLFRASADGLGITASLTATIDAWGDGSLTTFSLGSQTGTYIATVTPGDLAVLAELIAEMQKALIEWEVK